MIVPHQCTIRGADVEGAATSKCCWWTMFWCLGKDHDYDDDYDHDRDRCRDSDYNCEAAT